MERRKETEAAEELHRISQEGGERWKKELENLLMKEKITKSFQSFSLYLWLKTVYLKGCLLMELRTPFIDIKLNSSYSIGYMTGNYYYINGIFELIII